MKITKIDALSERGERLLGLGLCLFGATASFLNNFDTYHHSLVVPSAQAFFLVGTVIFCASFLPEKPPIPATVVFFIFVMLTAVCTMVYGLPFLASTALRSGWPLGSDRSPGIIYRIDKSLMSRGVRWAAYEFRSGDRTFKSAVQDNEKIFIEGAAVEVLFLKDYPVISIITPRPGAGGPADTAKGNP